MTDADAIRALLQASYEVISGPAGERDWERHREFFTPDARLTVVHRDRFEVMNEEQYRDSRSPFFRAHDFWERETRCDIQVSGNVATALSHYSCHWENDAPPFDTGVNAVLLNKHDGKWQIASIMWEAGTAAARVAELRR
jgi:hypothetical protein